MKTITKKLRNYCGNMAIASIILMFGWKPITCFIGFSAKWTVLMIAALAALLISKKAAAPVRNWLRCAAIISILLMFGWKLAIWFLFKLSAKWSLRITLVALVALLFREEQMAPVRKWLWRKAGQLFGAASNALQFASLLFETIRERQ